MKRIYVVSLPERVWHWAQATLFVVLAVTGFLMHGSAGLEEVSLAALIRVHNGAAVLFTVSFLFWLIYQVASGRVRHYVRFERDFGRRVAVQARFYLAGIFRGDPHPFPPTADSKFNALQRLTYAAVMFVLVPLQVLTGVVLLGFVLRVEWLENLPAFRRIALAHTGLSYALVVFLVAHLYLATTGETPLDLVRSMFTGYHTEREEASDGSP